MLHSQARWRISSGHGEEMHSPAMDVEYDDSGCMDPKWTGGSICMAASFKALDDGVEHAYIMQIGKWRSFAM